jgi:hypothetical protein
MFHPRPRNPAFAQQRIRFFPRRRRFGFAGCANFGFFPHRFGFAGGFNCFDDGIFFDPFLFGAFSVLGPVSDQSDGYQQIDSDASDQMFDSSDAAAPYPGSPNDDRPITLLQLLDGSMYGLTSYHVAGHELQYTTDYGAQNSIPLDRIDFTQTLRLNAERNVPFVLAPKPIPH